jgi:hypothetical protein
MRAAAAFTLVFSFALTVNPSTALADRVATAEREGSAAAAETAGAAGVVGCYRSLIYKSSEYTKRQIRVGKIDLLFMQTYTSFKSKAYPQVRKDAVLGLVQFMNRINHYHDRPMDFAKEKAECEQLSAKIKNDKSKDQLALLHNPSYMVDRSEGIYDVLAGNYDYRNLTAKQKALLDSVLTKESACTGISGKLAGAVGIAGAVGVSAYRCHGRGGQTWYALAPAGYAGAGVGAAGGGGIKMARAFDGWSRFADVRYTGMAGGSYVGGGYAEGDRVGIDFESGHGGMGLLVGTGAFTMAGGEVMIEAPLGKSNNVKEIEDALKP